MTSRKDEQLGKFAIEKGEKLHEYKNRLKDIVTEQSLDPLTLTNCSGMTALDIAIKTKKFDRALILLEAAGEYWQDRSFCITESHI